jgi:hypothetical protein
MPSRLSLFDQLNIAKTDAEAFEEEDDLDCQSRMEECYCIMMIGLEGEICYRRAVAGYVPASRWWMVSTKRQLVILG